MSAKNDAPRSPVQTHTPEAKEVAEQPSGPLGDNPGTAGPGQTAVRSKTPENAAGHINPSAPEDSNTTPGSTGKK